MADKATAELSIKAQLDAYAQTKSLEDFEKVLEAIKQSFLDTSKDGTKALEALVTPTEVSAKAIRSLNASVKTLGKSLKSLEVATSGLTALKNQKLFAGWKLEQTFGNEKYLSALRSNLAGINNELVRLNGPIGRLKNLNDTQLLNLSEGRTINQVKRLLKASNDRALYQTREGRDALELGYSQLKEKIADKSTVQTIRARTGLSNEAIEDAKKAARYSDSLAIVQLRLMANYKAINLVTSGFKYLLNYTVQYDKELHQLQSIAAVTNVGMRDLKNTID